MTPADTVALAERLDSHMGKADLQDVLTDCRQAAAALRESVSEIEGLKAERDAYREAAHPEAVCGNDAERQLTALRTQAPDSWRPIETYAGVGPVMVSTAPDNPKYLFSEPVSAFMDVGGTWRFLGSEGGMEPLPSWRQPTHWMPLPAAPALRPQTAESGT